MANSQKVTSFRDVRKLEVDKVVNAPRKDAGEKLGEALVDKQMPCAKDGTNDLNALLALDEEAVRAANKSDAQSLVDQLDTLKKVDERKAKALNLLRELQKENREKGVTVDTPAIQRLKAMLQAADEPSGFDEEAIVLKELREFHDQIRATLKEAQALVCELDGNKEPVDAERLDQVVGAYYRYFRDLRRDKLLEFVPGDKLEEWSRAKASFSDRAFAAKNDEGKRFWFWGVKGNEKSMVLCKAMTHLYAVLDRAMYLQKKAEERATKAQPPATTDTPAE